MASFKERLLAKVQHSEKGCWIFTGCRNPGGYGLIQGPQGKLGGVHRLSYEEFVGPIPEGLFIDHLCRNRACVNPAHLEPVTPKENTARSEVAETARWFQLSKTHCPQGHPYDGENLYLKPNGRRECRACVRESGARYRARKKAESASVNV